MPDPASLILLSQLNSVILVVGALLCFGEWSGYDGAAAYISAYGDWSHPVTFASLFVGYALGRVSDSQPTAHPCSSPRSSSLDFRYCEQCLRKYGEWFNSPLQYLRELKRTKKNKMKEIIRTMESFNNNLQGGKKLVKSLEKQSPVSVLQAPATPAVIATGASVRRLPAAPPTAHAHNRPRPRPRRRATADAALNSLLQADAPGLMVGSGLASQTQRVIKPVEA